jgi:hypothetical protein
MKIKEWIKDIQEQVGQKHFQMRIQQSVELRKAEEFTNTVLTNG